MNSNEVDESIARSASNFFWASSGVFPLPSNLKENQTRILFTGEFILSCYYKDTPKEYVALPLSRHNITHEIRSWVNAESHRLGWKRVEWFCDSMDGIGCYLCMPAEKSKTVTDFFKNMELRITSSWNLIPIREHDSCCPMVLYDENGRFIFTIDRNIYNEFIDS